MSSDCKPFACHDCDKKFKRSDHLKKHRRIHTGETPFGCTDCDKKFKQKSSLKIHRIIHTDEKQFVCPDCDKKFARSGSLKHIAKFTLVKSRLHVLIATKNSR